MSTNSQDQEIDLGLVAKGIKNFFQGVINSIFDFIFFHKKKFIFFTTLGLLGIVAAFLLASKNYTHEVTVIPNFKSNEYLYTKITQINTKLKEGDSLFFKQLGVKDFKRINKLWDIRNQTRCISEKEMNRSHKLLDENRKDLMEWVDKYEFF